MIRRGTKPTETPSVGRINGRTVMVTRSWGSPDHPGYVDYTDTDTHDYGRLAPFQPWEADSRGLVGILWGFRHAGLMVDRPGLRAPLRQALFNRLFGRDSSNHDLIADLRTILDTYDPEVTPGAMGARYLTQDEERAAEVEENARCLRENEPIDTTCASDTAANAIMGSRWRYALEAHAQARALIEAARVEEEAGNPESAQRLRVRAEEITGVPAALERDRPAVESTPGAVS